MERHRRIGLAVFVALILSSGLVACSGFSLFGGVAGGVLAVVAIVFWFATATTQTACEVQSCLSLREPDSGVHEDVGPCLSFIPDVGPCLSPPPPDAGFDDAAEDGDVIGPCLSQPPPDAEVPEDAGEPDALPVDVATAPSRQVPTLARREAIDRLARSGVLPADVATRLLGKDDEEA